jgi:hypothetical protein
MTTPNRAQEKANPFRNGTSKLFFFLYNLIPRQTCKLQSIKTCVITTFHILCALGFNATALNLTINKTEFSALKMNAELFFLMLSF